MSIESPDHQGGDGTEREEEASAKPIDATVGDGKVRSGGGGDGGKRQPVPRYDDVQENKLSEA